MPNLIPLPRLASELKKLTGVPGLGYRQLYMLTVDGRIPTEIVSGRYFFKNEDLPAIAATLGLTVSPALAAA